jgi:hypothetical protein
VRTSSCQGPGNFVVRGTRGPACLAVRKPEPTVVDLLSAIEPSGRNLHFLADLGLAYGLAARGDEARRILRELKECSRTRYVSPYQLAFAHLAVGEKNEAYRALERGFDGRTPACLSCQATRSSPSFAGTDDSTNSSRASAGP